MVLKGKWVFLKEIIKSTQSIDSSIVKLIVVTYQCINLQ